MFTTSKVLEYFDAYEFTSTVVSCFLARARSNYEDQIFLALYTLYVDLF
jgi:hypothetical protein